MDNNVLSFERTDSFSISLWVKGTNLLELIGKHAPEQGYWLTFQNTGTLRFFIANGASNRIVVEAASLGTIRTNNTWQHIIVTYDGTSLASGVKIYLNKVLRSLTTVQNNLTNSIIHSEPLTIGAWEDGSFTSDGIIDDVRMYDHVLSQSEVDELYNLAPFIWWKLDETSGTTIFDSRNNTNLTVTNANLSVNWVPGIIDNAFQTDGIDDNAWALSTANNTYGVVVSKSLWVKFTSSLSGIILTKVFRYAGDSVFEIGLSDKISFYVGTTGLQAMQLISSNSYNDGNWHHVVGIRNGDNFKLYVDTVLVGNITKTGVDTGYDNLSSTHRIEIGARRGTLYRKAAAVDQIKIFRKELTTQEIMELYEEGHGPLLCWNYKARYKNSNRLFVANGGGKFPSELKVPSSVDISTGVMMDEGIFIEPNRYKIV